MADNLQSVWIHPFRWQRQVPDSKALVNAFRRIVGRAESMSLEAAVPRLKEYNEFSANILRQTMVPSGIRHNLIASLEYQNAAVSFARFAAYGRNIFRISADLVEMLRRTSLTDVRLADVKMPFPSFYLSFGSGLPEGFPGSENVIDGVYVNATNWDPARDLVLQFTSRKVAGYVNQGHWLNTLDECLTATFVGAWLGPDPTWEDAFAQLPRMRKAMFARILHNDPSGGSRVFERDYLDMFDRRLAAIREPLGLLANVLCYLTAVPDDLEEAWPDDAPAKLLARLSTGSHSERERARASLLDGGFSILNAVRGPAAEADLQAGNGTDKEMPAHWRKGHWRRQAHGPGHSMHRLIWLKPTIVRRDLGEPAHGHVYNAYPPMA